MTRTRIKICGVRDKAIAQAAAQGGADFVGLVLVEKSPRYVNVDQAKAIVASLPDNVEPIGLFVDQSADYIKSICQTVGLHAVQLHGHETPDIVPLLKPLSIIKALPFDAKHITQTLAPWRDVKWQLKAIMLDAPAGDNNLTRGLTGGSGNTLDWNALARCQQEGLFDDLPPIILAGGLTPQNVAQAINLVQPYAVDVSSGVESSRGKKDPQLITAFCQAVLTLSPQ